LEGEWGRGSGGARVHVAAKNVKTRGKGRSRRMVSVCVRVNPEAKERHEDRGEGGEDCRGADGREEALL
jgi:hypothetical protein